MGDVVRSCPWKHLFNFTPVTTLPSLDNSTRNASKVNFTLVLDTKMLGTQTVNTVACVTKDMLDQAVRTSSAHPVLMSWEEKVLNLDRATLRSKSLFSLPLCYTRPLLHSALSHIC